MFRNMTETDWKEFVQAESEIEAEEILRQVDLDPIARTAVAPEEMHEKLMRKIRKSEGDCE